MPKPVSTLKKKKKVLAVATTTAQSITTQKPVKGKDYRHKTEKEWERPNNIGKNYGRSIVNIRKTHRNDPCPCGSGKKHKNCHLVSKH